MKSRTALLLGFYSKFRGTRPTVLQAFARQPPLFWVAMLAMVLIASAYYFLVGDSTSFLLFGVVIGALARDVGWMLRFRRDWPILDRVLDWDLVSRELGR